MSRRLAAAAGLATVLVVCGLATEARAQSVLTQFDQLSGRLKPGDTIWVTDAEGREIEGRIVSLAADAVALDGKQPRTLAAADVRVIQTRGARPIGKGAMWGSIAGAGLVIAAIVAAGGYHSDSEDASVGVTLYFVGVSAGCGALLGAGIGAAIPGSRRDVYRAPGVAPAPRLAVAPIVTPHTRGIAASFSF